MTASRIYLDKRRAKKDGTYPVKIRIPQDRSNVKLFPTVYSLTEKEFEKIMSNFRLNEEQRQIRARIDALLLKADNIIRDLNPFSFEAFTVRFTAKGDRTDLLFLLDTKAEQLRMDDKHANANLYQQAATLLRKYVDPNDGGKSIPISTVSPDWLRHFQKWAMDKGYTNTTIGMYLIRVRAIFNSVIEAGELERSRYPFGRGKFQIPAANNHKRALSLEEIMLIYNYKSENLGLQFARDIFIFSYLANGMNTYDIWRLKWSNIKENKFSFIRKKTEGKTRGRNEITVTLNDDLKEIIERHGSRKLGSDYVFEVIKPGMNAKEEMQAVKRATTGINTGLKKIASELGISSNISTYYARHSFATILMNSEVPLPFISKQLGHADLKTTQNYLDSFTSDKIAEYQANLLSKQTG